MRNGKSRREIPKPMDLYHEKKNSCHWNNWALTLKLSELTSTFFILFPWSVSLLLYQYDMDLRTVSLWQILKLDTMIPLTSHFFSRLPYHAHFSSTCTKTATIQISMSPAQGSHTNLWSPPYFLSQAGQDSTSTRACISQSKSRLLELSHSIG